MQNDLQRFEQTQRSQERALWLLYIEGPGVAPFCERLLRRRLVIGRDAGCSLPLRGETMAPQHALLEHDDESDHWVVVPVANDRPTFVNGKRVQVRTPLGPEDRVQVGPWLLRIGVEGDDDWHQKLRFATFHSQPEVPGLAKETATKPDRLIVLSGPVPPKEIRLDEGPVRLGPVKGSSLVPERGALADLNVEVSPLPNGSYELVCHGEGGTVSVNGVVGRRVVLAPGDRLRLGGGTGAAYLVFAGRGGDPPSSKKADAGASGRGLPPLSAFSKTESVGNLRRADPTALGSQSAPEGEAAWSLQAMGLGGEAPKTPWLGPPTLDEAPASGEALPEAEAAAAAEPKPTLESTLSNRVEPLRRRVSTMTATLIVVTTVLLGLCVLGVTSLVQKRKPEAESPAEDASSIGSPAPDANGAPTPPAAARAGAEKAGEGEATSTRPLAEAGTIEAAPEVAREPEAPQGEPTARPEEATPTRVAPREEAAPRPAPLPVKAPVVSEPGRVAAPTTPTTTPTPRASAPREAPKPRQGADSADKGGVCGRLRALQRSGRATPDDERMLQNCH